MHNKSDQNYKNKTYIYITAAIFFRIEISHRLLCYAMKNIYKLKEKKILSSWNEMMIYNIFNCEILGLKLHDKWLSVNTAP